MSFTLSDEEVRALHEALSNYLPQLDFDLARIKHDRHHLATIEAVLQKLNKRLAEAVKGAT